MTAINVKLLFITLLIAVASPSARADTLKALIIDGQNNHSDWPKTTMMMKAYLEASDRFTVDIRRTKFMWRGEERLKEFPLDDGRQYESLPQSKSDPEFAPVFKDYDVVISNFGFNAAPWPEATREAFVEYVKGGGGLVIVHAADNSFGDWDEFNRMIGLGGWGGRNEKTGPYIYIDEDGKTIRDEAPGSGGSHGPQHEFTIVVREPDHPITKGLPSSWLHSKDELYQSLRGPGEQMTILATAFADEEYKGTGRHEPMIMTVEYGQGRVYHTPMGHADYSMECVGFITTLLRGAEWAATGAVTLTEIPDDFPTASKASARKFAAPVTTP